MHHARSPGASLPCAFPFGTRRHPAPKLRCCYTSYVAEWDCVPLACSVRGAYGRGRAASMGLSGRHMHPSVTLFDDRMLTECERARGVWGRVCVVRVVMRNVVAGSGVR